MPHHSILLIGCDCNREDAVVEIVKSLQQLQLAAEEVFNRSADRLNRCQNRVLGFVSRLDVLDRKLETLKNTNESPILCNLSKYPEIGDGTDKAVFDIISSATPFYARSSNDVFQSPSKASPISTRSIKAAYMQKKDYKYVFDKKPKYMEALALKPVHCHAVDFEKQMDHNLCYEVDDQLELYEKMDNQCKPVKASTSTDFSESLLIHCEFNRSDRSSDPFSYKPEVDDLNAFDFPDVLPNLPGTSSSKNIAFNDAFFQSIAPSSAYFNLAQQPNSDIDLSARNSFYQLEESLQSQPVQSKPPVSISSVRSLVTTNGPKPVTHFIPSIDPVISVANISLSEPKTMTPTPDFHFILNTGAAPLAMSSPPAPPPPPPPPPPPSLLLAQPANGVSKPVVLESTKGRSDLMESIRAAGGLKKLKKVDKSPASSESGSSYKQHSKVPSNAESGDDLMSSLAKALEMRRKGISGKNNKEDKFSHLEKSSKTSDGAKGNEPLSRLRQLIPPPSAQKSISQHRREQIDEDGDWTS